VRSRLSRDDPKPHPPWRTSGSEAGAASPPYPSFAATAVIVAQSGSGTRYLAVLPGPNRVEGGAEAGYVTDGPTSSCIRSRTQRRSRPGSHTSVRLVAMADSGAFGHRGRCTPVLRTVGITGCDHMATTIIVTNRMSPNPKNIDSATANA
jgi:hypothetical protein